MMQSLGEMATQFAHSRLLRKRMRSAFVDPSLAFCRWLELLVQLGDHPGGRNWSLGR